MEVQIPVKMQTEKLAEIANIVSDGQKDYKSEKYETGNKTNKLDTVADKVKTSVCEQMPSSSPKLFYRTQVNGERKLVFVRPNLPILNEKINAKESQHQTTATQPNSSQHEATEQEVQTSVDAQAKTTKLVFSIKHDAAEREPHKSTLLPGTNMEYRTPGAHYLNKNGQVKRPMNAFMVWARDYRGYLAATMPNATNSEISVRLGQEWAKLKPEAKQYFYKIAERIKRKHRSDFPDWVYKPSGRKTEGNLDLIGTPSTDAKVHSEAQFQASQLQIQTESSTSTARPILPAPVIQATTTAATSTTPTSMKSLAPVTTSTRLVPVSSISIQTIKPLLPPNQASSTPVRGLIPRSFITSPVTSVPKAINVQLGSNGILRTDQPTAVSETTKSLLSNKLCRSIANVPGANLSKTLLEVSSTMSVTEPRINAMLVTVARNEIPTQQAIKAVPVNIRIATDPNRPTLSGGTQIQSSNLSKLLTEPLNNNQPKIYWRPDLARQKNYATTIPGSIQQPIFISDNGQRPLQTQPDFFASKNNSPFQTQVLYSENSKPIPQTQPVFIGQAQPVFISRDSHVALSAFKQNPDTSDIQVSAKPVANDTVKQSPLVADGQDDINEKQDTEASETARTLDELASGASTTHGEESEDDMWPFPFSQEPSDSWSENYDRQQLYEELLDSFSSSFDDSDYLYSEVFPGCLKLDVDSWRRYLEDEDDIGSLVDPEACFKSDQTGDISISPVPLAQTLEDTHENIDPTDKTVAENIPMNELSKTYAAHDVNANIVNNIEVQKSISYFSELTSKVNHILRQSEDSMLDEQIKASEQDLVGCLDEKTLDEYLKTIGQSEPVEPEVFKGIFNDITSTSCEKEQNVEQSSSEDEQQASQSAGITSPPKNTTIKENKTGKVLFEKQSKEQADGLMADDKISPSDAQPNTNTLTKSAEYSHGTGHDKPEITVLTLCRHDFHDRVGDTIHKELPNTVQTFHKKTDDKINKAIASSSYKTLEKGDLGSGYTIHYENEIATTRASSSTARRVRQTNSLTGVEKSNDKSQDPERGIISSPCKRQRSTTCLIENESTRRKL